MTWEDYRRAQVRLYTPNGTLTVRATGTEASEGPFPPVHGESIHILTAHNPAGTVQDALANDAAHGRLIAELAARGYEFWDADGGDESWTHVEKSVALLGLTAAQARELGSQFGQDAVFSWTPESWSLLECGGASTLDSSYGSSYDDGL